MKGNLFKNTRLNFNDFCSYYQDQADAASFSMSQTTPARGLAYFWTSPTTFADPNKNPRYKDLVPNQNDAYQLHSLIVIDNLKASESVQLLNNVFEGNIVTNGLISITQANVLS